MLHAHFSSESQDCDGRYSSEWIVAQPPEEASGDFADIDFHDKIVAQVVNSYSLDHTGTLTVTRHESGTTLDWSEPTDEGHRSISAQFCEDETCDVDTYSQRDHSAEKAGY
jgi:hypothetical protein